jgi:hypothetical protein
MHFISFESHATDSHVGKVIAVFTNIYLGVATLSAIEIDVVDIPWEASVIIVEPDLWTRTNSFASAHIQETYLVPYEAPYLDLNW